MECSYQVRCILLFTGTHWFAIRVKDCQYFQHDGLRNDRVESEISKHEFTRLVGQNQRTAFYVKGEYRYNNATLTA